MVRAASVASWIVWTTYVALGLAVTVFAYLVQSRRMDIGSTMASVVLLGAVGTAVAVAMFSGSVIGTAALVRTPAARRLGHIATVVAGWAGASILAWLSWSFWTSP